MPTNFGTSLINNCGVKPRSHSKKINWKSNRFNNEGCFFFFIFLKLLQLLLLQLLLLLLLDVVVVVVGCGFGLSGIPIGDIRIRVLMDCLCLSAKATDK